MERALRPERFDSLPNVSSSAKEFTHWFRTFENFVAVLPQENLDKLVVLTNFLSPDVFEFISECETYEEAVEILRRAYVKPPSVVFARHTLSSRRQAQGETVDEYMQVLKALSKDCQFQSVTAVEHREQYIRDTFIAGLSSKHIQQRILENNTTELSSVFLEARSLESAQKNVESYSHNQSFSVNSVGAVNSAVASEQSQSFSAAVKSSTAVQSSGTCWNCGNPCHAKARCPARNETCFTCGKKGHLAKYCRSKEKPAEDSSRVASVHFPSIA